MIGFNADDGSAFIWSLENGTTYEALDNELRQLTCPSLTKLSVELCVDYVTNLYGLDTITDDRQRGLANIHFFSKFLSVKSGTCQLLSCPQSTSATTHCELCAPAIGGYKALQHCLILTAIQTNMIIIDNEMRS